MLRGVSACLLALAFAVPGAASGQAADTPERACGAPSPGYATCFAEVMPASGVAGQASIDKVAGPVGEALIMTALGLAVAVPAVLLYNYLVRRNKIITEKLRSFAGDLQTYLISNKK